MQPHIVVNRVCSEGEILGLLEKFNEDFSRPITSRVPNLGRHARQLRDRAFVYSAEREGALAGFVAFYANDVVSSTAFLTHIAVNELSRGLGVGLTLMRVCLGVSRDAGMTKLKLEVDTSNRRAIAFYESLGFSHYGWASPESCYMILDPLRTCERT